MVPVFWFACRRLRLGLAILCLTLAGWELRRAMPRCLTGAIPARGGRI